MKKLKVMLYLMAVLLLFPVGVSAKEKINVYLFRRDGCGYCENALKFFSSLKEDNEYKNYFNLVEKEVSSSKENSKLMQSVANKLDKEVNGVPFIVIGKESFLGYSSTYDDSIKETIKTAYENEDGSYKDIVLSLTGSNEKKENNDAAITIVVLAVAAAGVIFLIYMAKEQPVTVEEKKIVEEKVVEENVEEPKVEKKTSNKKTPAKKTTTPKKSATTKKTTNKPVAKKTTAKKATAKTTSAKKTTAKKATPAKKSTPTKKTTNKNKAK